MPKIKTGLPILITTGAFLTLPQTAFAAVDPETNFVFNTLIFYLGGILVMWMAAGFTRLETGLVRSKNSAMMCLNNVGLYSVTGLMFWICGYDMIYGIEKGGYINIPDFFWTADDPTEFSEDGKYAAASDWFFQMAFVAATASIICGTVAERIKFWGFMVFVAVMTGFLYPITASWGWGGGWLAELGFSDFAGSSYVHSFGGWAALTGAIVLGARKGKYLSGGRINPMPGSNLPLATLGTFILWMGWFGFNGASQLALGSGPDAIAIATIVMNSNMAAVSGAITTMVVMQLVYKKIDLTMVLNGALAGLVAITAEPLEATVPEAMVIGTVGALIVIYLVPLLDRLKIDDVVGAIPVHLGAGLWGTLCVAYTKDSATLMGQLTGMFAIAVFTIVASALVWLAIKHTMGLRVSEEEEFNGLDRSFLGVESYPEFGQGSQRFG
jgi:ammonium transporter, Amt family